MAYSLTFSRRAAGYLRRMDRASQQRIAVALRALCDDPYGRGTKPLKDAAGRRAVRIGGWRLVYLVDEAEANVHVDLIGPRGDVYRDL